MSSQAYILPQRSLDSFQWAKNSILAPLLKKGAQNGKTRFYKVNASHAGVRNGNNRTYTEDEMMKSAASLSHRPLDINHDAGANGIPHGKAGHQCQILPYGEDSLPLGETFIPENGVVSARYENGILECVIAVSDPDTISKIDSGDIQYVSVDGGWLDESNDNTPTGDYPTSMEFNRLALLTKDKQPADPRAKIIRDSVESLARLQDLAPRIIEALVIPRDRAEMHPDFQKLQKAMQKEYGEKKGKGVFWATVNGDHLDETRPMKGANTPKHNVPPNLKDADHVYEWFTSGDDAVCDICDGFDGRKFSDLEETDSPPVHPNCRCALIDEGNPIYDDLKSKSSVKSGKREMSARMSSQALKDAEMSASEINDLPDSSFAIVEAGGHKDEEGKTVPRTLRHLPYKDANGKVDLPHLRNALARLPQTKGLTPQEKAAATKKLQAAAKSAGVGDYGDAKDATERMCEDLELMDDTVAPERKKEIKSARAKALREARKQERLQEKAKLKEQLQKVNDDLIILDPDGDESSQLLQNSAEDQLEGAPSAFGQSFAGKTKDSDPNPRDPKMQDPGNDQHSPHKGGLDDGDKGLKKVSVGELPQGGNEVRDDVKGPAEKALSEPLAGGMGSGDGKVPAGKPTPGGSEGQKDGEVLHATLEDKLEATSGKVDPTGHAITQAENKNDPALVKAQVSNPNEKIVQGIEQAKDGSITDDLAQQIIAMGKDAKALNPESAKDAMKMSQTAPAEQKAAPSTPAPNPELDAQTKKFQDALNEFKTGLTNTIVQSYEEATKKIMEKATPNARVQSVSTMAPVADALAPLSAAHARMRMQDAWRQENLPRYEAIWKRMKDSVSTNPATYQNGLFIGRKLSPTEVEEYHKLRDDLQIKRAQEDISYSAAASALGQVWLPDMVLLPTDLAANLRNFCQVQIIPQGADRVKFVTLTQPSFASLTDDSIPSDVSQTVANITATPSETGAKQRISYQVMESSTPDMVAGVEKQLMYAAIIDEDNTILTALGAATLPTGSTIYASTATAENQITSSMTFLGKYLATATAAINKQGYVVNTGDLVAVLSTAQWQALAQDTAISQFLNYGSYAPIQFGTIPQVYGVDIVRSTKVPTGSGSGSPATTTYHCFVWLKPSARGAYGMGLGGAVGLGISRDLLIETWRYPPERDLYLVASHRIAAVVIQPNAVAEIITA